MLIALCLLLAYLLGSVSGGLLLGPLFGREDLRQTGSGNAGATNALRSGGKAYGISVLLFDLAKGLLAAAWLPWITGEQPAYLLSLACGGLAVIGHVWPLWFGFRGGKGVATLIGALIYLLPVALLAGLIAWLLCLVFTGYVGLASMLGMTAVLLILPLLGAAKTTFVFAALMWALVIYTHRENIARLRAGTESRFERAMLFRR